MDIKKLAIGLGSAIAALALIVTPVFADAFPAENAAACTTNVGGVFTVVDGPPPPTDQKCVVTNVVNDSVTIPVGKGNSNNGKVWTIYWEQTTTTTYELTHNPPGRPVQTTTVVEGPKVVTSCTNPGGHSVDLSNSHCQLPE